MSTHINDLAGSASIATAVSPRTATATVTGAALDFGETEGAAFAVQQVGTVGGTAPALAGKIQQSADSATWADVAGATFTAVAADTPQTITFRRAQRYVRYVGTVTGTSPSIGLAVVVGAGRKQA